MFTAGLIAALVGIGTIIGVFIAVCLIEFVAVIGARTWTKILTLPKRFARSSISESSASSQAAS